mmetsp:Transcript_74112/g.191165  ORF Transcript_74112/g.191165 Transcript_74112/m.191165 type:complete len:168 (-) Transcript_74112:70-573(-)
MAQAGLHKINHLFSTDGGGRDSLIFHDGGWRHGKLHGNGREPAYHPLFSLGNKVTHFKIEPAPKPFRVPGSTAPDPAASLRSPDEPARWRLPGGGVLVKFPQTQTLAKSSSHGSLAAAGSRRLSDASPKHTPAWRTRETCTSFDSWHLKMSGAACSTKKMKRSSSAA